MHKAIKLATLIGFTGLLGACAHPHKVSMPVKKTYALNGADQLVVADVNQLDVQKTKGQPRLVFIAKPEQAPDINASQDHHTLNITGNAPGTHITIYASRLRTLSADDVNHLSLSSGLRIKSIQLNGNTHAHIRGTVYFDQLSARDQSQINAHAIWLKQLYLYDQSSAHINTLSAKNLYIEMHQRSEAVISGRANVLQATLSNASKLAAKRFYVQRAFVKAFGHSFARVHVSKTLFSFNVPTSVIEYYGTPKVYRRALNASATLPMSKDADF